MRVLVAHSCCSSLRSLFHQLFSPSIIYPIPTQEADNVLATSLGLQMLMGGGIKKNIKTVSSSSSSLNLQPVAMTGKDKIEKFEMWAGHIARLTDQRWTSRVTRWTGPPGKRRPGRPLSRWEDDIKRTAGTNWRLVAQDRDKWKSLEEASLGWPYSRGGICQPGPSLRGPPTGLGCGNRRRGGQRRLSPSFCDLNVKLDQIVRSYNSREMNMVEPAYKHKSGSERRKNKRKIEFQTAVSNPKQSRLSFTFTSQKLEDPQNRSNRQPGIDYRRKSEALYSLTDIANDNQNHGIFLNLVVLLSTYDPVLKAHISEAITESKKRKDSRKVKQEIVIEIQTAKSFSLNVDSCQDVGVVDRAAICVRYVKIGIPQERMLSMVLVRKSTGEDYRALISNEVAHIPSTIILVSGPRRGQPHGPFGPSPTLLTDEFREGRPKSVVVPQNPNVVRELIMQDHHVTCREIKASLGKKSKVKEKNGNEIEIRIETGFCTSIETKSRTKSGIGIKTETSVNHHHQDVGLEFGVESETLGPQAQVRSEERSASAPGPGSERRANAWAPDRVLSKSQLGLVAESELELKARRGTKSRKGPSSESNGRSSPKLSRKGTRIRNECGDGIRVKTVTGLGNENETRIEIYIFDSTEEKNHSTSLLVELRVLTIRASHSQESAEQRLPSRLVININK
ncbi:hypothetical protein EVAR_30455_1 [Eumeta japonica]|uniref:Uncharacterized protein n=1 Tax=Eumeta variegata TaxID=151549 RepID=A0A4C1VWV2_EUMVA|nr:hypothetical protein EVAR_30455_1 [Eumeta japonica]